MADTTTGYAVAVVRTLRSHFPGLADPDTARTVAAAIRHQMLDPQDSFEVIVDDPGSARWRLKPDRLLDRCRVRLIHYPVIPPGSPASHELEQTVNDALRALPVSSAPGGAQQ